MTIIYTIFNFLRKFSPILYPAVIILLGITCFNLNAHNNDLEKAQDVSDKRVTMATKVLDKYNDDQGRQHLVIESGVISKNQKSALMKNTGLIDTVATALKIAKNRINELTVIKASLEALLLKGKVNPTTNIVEYKDAYADISYNPIDTTFGLKYNVKLITAGYQKKTGFLNLSRTNVLDLYSEDKRVKINGVERFQVEVPDPNFGVRGQVKAQYNFAEKTISPAATLEANYKSYTAEANLFYNFKDKHFIPTVGIKKDLFRIK